jgi:cytochrome b561
MELFWLIAGVVVFAFAIYLYVNDIETQDLKMYFMMGSMAIVLSVFRIVYRKQVAEKEEKPKNQQDK